MPWITAFTPIRVVVDRMIPSSVRKLRSLLERKESRATDAASRNDARDCTCYSGYERRLLFVPDRGHPFHHHSVQPEARTPARDETEMTAVVHCQQVQIGI